MSASAPHSSPWSVINKVIAIVLAVGAAYFPITFVLGGIKASYNLRHPQPAVQASAIPTASPAIATPASEASPEAPSAPAGDGLTAQMAEGQKTYMMVCFACHQPTGLGMLNMFPPLAGSDWVIAPKPDRIIRNVLHGMTGPISINGKPFATAAPLMPPQGAALSDKQIADVLTYVRNSWGNKASAVTPEEVKAIRDVEKARTAMWTEAELLKIADR